MKQKFEKVLELTPITMTICDERAKEIAKRWTHKGLDFLLEMWHKYYDTTSHLLINSLLKFKEKELRLNNLEKCLIDTQKENILNNEN